MSRVWCFKLQFSWLHGGVRLRGAAKWTGHVHAHVSPLPWISFLGRSPRGTEKFPVLYGRLWLVIYRNHRTNGNPSFPPPPSTLTLWNLYVCSLCLCLYFSFANEFLLNVRVIHCYPTEVFSWWNTSFNHRNPQTLQSLDGFFLMFKWTMITHMILHFFHLGSQSSLDDVIKNLAAIKLGKVKQTQCFLYMASEAGKKLATSLLDEKKLSVNGDKYKSR